MYRAALIISILIITATSCFVGSNSSPQNDTIVLPKYYDTIFRTPPKQKQIRNFYALEYDGGIFVGNSVDLLDKLDINGSSPAISPDGRFVAYSPQNTDKGIFRIYDIENKQETSIDVAYENVKPQCYRCDGNYILLTAKRNDTISAILVYDIENNSTIELKTENRQLYSPSFSSNGNYVVCHNLQSVLIYSFNGDDFKYYQSIDCGSLCIDNDATMNNTCSLYFRDSTESLIYNFEQHIDEENSIWSMYVYFMGDGKIQKISRHGESCKTFAGSKNGNVYYAIDNGEGYSEMFLTTKSDNKLVKISNNKFLNLRRISLAY